MFMLTQPHADRAAMHHRHLGGNDAILPRWASKSGVRRHQPCGYFISRQRSKFVMAVSMLIDHSAASVTELQKPGANPSQINVLRF
jgi:hypothetical protein